MAIHFLALWRAKLSASLSFYPFFKPVGRQQKIFVLSTKISIFKFTAVYLKHFLRIHFVKSLDLYWHTLKEIILNILNISDPLSSLLPSAHPYPDPLRERELRERNALVQSAFSMGSLYPPNPLLPPSDHYPSSFGGPLGLPPPPVSSPQTMGPHYNPNIGPRPEISPSSLTSPIQRHRDPSPKVTTSTFSPHSGGSSPFLSPAPPSANNSSLAEKLKVGFGDRSPTTTPAKPQDFSPTRPSGPSRDSSRDHSSQDQSPRRPTTQEGSILHETYIRSSGPLTNTQASSASTLVTSSSQSGKS